MPRLVHKATDGLSAEAQRLMMAGFRGKRTYAAIVRQIEETTGEKVAPSTLARRSSEWRTEQSRRQAAREYVGDLVAELKANNFTATEMAEALLTDALMANADGFKNADPLKVQAQNLRAREVATKERELGIKTRAIELDERRLKLIEDREQRVKTTLEKPAEEMTPEQRLREIQAIYGIRREANV